MFEQYDLEPEPYLDEYTKMHLLLSSLDLPPDEVNRLIIQVPLPELKRNILDCIARDLNLGVFIDRFLYRDQSIRDQVPAEFLEEFLNGR